MHCPGCGQPASMDQKFCRSCGMDLKEISEIVKAKASSDDTGLSPSEHERKALACMVKGMGRGGIVFFIGLVMIVLSKKYFHNELFTLISTLVILLGVFVMAYALYAAMMSEAKAPGAPRRPKVDTRPDLASARSPELISAVPASITERTTSLIEAQPALDPKRETGKMLRPEERA